MEVFVTGGSGYVGRYVLRALAREGHRVRALARSPSATAVVVAAGAEAVAGDVTRPGAWQEVARHAEAIVHLAVPAPDAYRRFTDWTPFPARWTEAVSRFEARALPLLFAAAEGSARCRAVITTTGPAATGSHGDSLVNEDARGPCSAFGEVQRQVEERTLEAAAKGLPAAVLRPGAVYGPDGGFAARVLNRARRGLVVYVGRGRNYVSWVHIEDYAAAYVRAIHGGASGHVVAIVDDEPLPSREAMEVLAACAGARRPVSVPASLVRFLQGRTVAGWATQSARVANARAKTLLGWGPRFATVREGFPAVLRAARSG